MAGDGQPNDLAVRRRMRSAGTKAVTRRPRKRLGYRTPEECYAR